jgi:protein-S-isoprenylcysteine O-methyltransferase Ste14
MYISEQGMWLGWAVFFGSPVVLGAGAALTAAMRYAVGREEKTLESQFGDSWRRYKETVPRWI